MKEFDLGYKMPPVKPPKEEAEPLYKDMTLRDWFAGKCVTGLLPGSSFAKQELLDRAKLAYRMADAMMKEREK